jgi:hypothetical protein
VIGGKNVLAPEALMMMAMAFIVVQGRAYFHRM